MSARQVNVLLIFVGFYPVLLFRTEILFLDL